MGRNSNQKMLVNDDNFTQNDMVFHVIVCDESSSMFDNDKDDAVRKGLQIIKNQLSSMENTTSTRVAMIYFGDDITFTNFERIEDNDFSYQAKNALTCLYDSLVFLQKQLKDIYMEYSINRGYKLNINVIYLSDGQNCGSNATISDAINAVDDIKKTTKASMLFYDIGHSNIEVARELGFTVKGLDATEESILNFSQEISQRLVESSQSGTTIENLSKMMSSSSMASEEYKELMEQTSINDPLKDLFDYV